MKQKFDVFLSRKSEDFHFVDQIYQFLVGRGLKVFDANYSLTEIGKDEYGKVINKIIPEIKHFILFGSSIEHITSSWVQHEWQLYLSLKKTQTITGNFIMVITNDVQITQLPPELRIYEVISFDNYKDRILNYLIQNNNETNIKLIEENFIGREDKIEEISKILANRENRLVSLVGTGGFGKTRLATEIGIQLNYLYANGVWFINLIDADSETGLAKALFDALGENMTSSQISAREAIVLLLQERNDSLFIFDNFEQIVEACSETIDFILNNIQNIQILVTSTISLKLTYANEIKIQPLKIIKLNETKPEILNENESIKLFLKEANKKNKDLYINQESLININKICNELEGIPLAIELAACRTDTMHLVEILEGIKENIYEHLQDDSFNRHVKHRTLESVVSWSFNLLTKNEKEVFTQLSIFKSSFIFEIASQIILIDGKHNKNELRKILNNLVKKNLLKANTTLNPTRNSFPVTLHNYSKVFLMGRKSKAYEKRLIDRCADVYTEFLKNETKKSRNTSDHKSLTKIHAELENVFSIQEALINKGSYTESAEIILSFSDIMSIKGPALLRIPRLKLSYDKFEDKNNNHCCRLAIELSNAYQSRGNWDEGDFFSEIAVIIAREIGNKKLLAHALTQLSRMKKSRGYKNLSLMYIEEAFDLYKKLDKSKNMATSLNVIGDIKERTGFFDEAIQTYDSALDIAEKNADEIQKELLFNSKALAYWHHGKPYKALEMIEIAEKLAEKMGNEFWKPAHLTNKGLILSDLAQYEDALDSFQKAEEMHSKRGTIHWAAVNYGGWGRTLLMMNDDIETIQKAIHFLERAEKSSKDIFYPENISLHSGDLGRAYLKNGNPHDALSKVSEAISIERITGSINEHRHYCNLIVQAEIAKSLGKDDLLWESLSLADELANKLGIDETYEIVKVRKDYKTMNLLRKLWKEKYKSVLAKDSNKSYASLTPPSKISEIEINGETAFNLLNIIQNRLSKMIFEYPWKYLEITLQKKKNTSIKLFSYGSLLSSSSAKTTLSSNSVDSHLPVIGFGIRRLLNYNMPDEISHRPIYQPMTGPLARGLFNVKLTGSITDTVNGILIDVDISEIIRLREREVGYDLMPIVCIPWNDRESTPIEAYTLGCPDRMYKGKKLTGADLTPHIGYYNVCKDGASCISDEFLDYFLETSYLADNKTTVRNWRNSIDGQF